VSEYTPQQLRSKLEGIDREMTTLQARQAGDGLSPGEEEHLRRLNSQWHRLVGEYEEHQERARRREEIGRGPNSRIHSLPESTTNTLADVQNEALRSLDRLSGKFSTAAIDQQEALVRQDSQYAAEIEVHSRPEYETAFQKYCQHGPMASAAMDDAERAAVHDSLQVRAQAEGQTTQGGFAVPVQLDPTVILSNQEIDNPFLRVARVVPVTTNVWKGVSSAGVVFSFDAEGAEVSDDSITLSQPTVNVFMARGFIPFSIEVEQDWPAFQAEMARLLAAGYNDLVLQAFTTGTGTGQPRGILTALVANGADQVTVTTDGSFGQEDIYKVWKALPQKSRQKASWMMSVDVMNRIRQMGTNVNQHALTVPLPDGAIDRLFERAVYENSYFPDFTGTTGQASILVVGDFSEFVVAQRSGLSVELVPHLVGSGNRFPTGQRGWFAFGRVGSNSVMDTAFRILVNT
jgi:HK97 family phage major capsid protein